MLLWLTTLRWRRSAEAAISSAHFEAERQRLAADLLARTSAVRGGSSHPEIKATTSITGVIDRLVDKRLLQACLGLRYLELMQDRTRRADYEDAARLRAECKWLERYLTARLRSEWVRTARNTSPMGLLPSPDELCAAVAARIVSDLNAATLAA